MDVHCASWGFEMLGEGEGEGVVTLWAAKRLYEQKASLLNGRASVFWGHQLVYMSSCIECKQRISLPSVWACVSWGSQPVCRRSCTVCKQQASLQCELDRPQSLFYFVLQEISQPSRIGFCEPEHVSFQFGSTGGWVAAQVAAVGLLSTMLNHVHFEIFCHLEEEITLRTWVRSVFSLYFNFHGWFSGQALQWCCLINQAASTVEGWVKIELLSRWKLEAEFRNNWVSLVSCVSWVSWVNWVSWVSWVS